MAIDDVFAYYAGAYRIPKRVLRAIARHESNMHPWTFNMVGRSKEKTSFESFYCDDKDSCLKMLAKIVDKPWLVKVKLKNGETKRFLFESKVKAYRKKKISRLVYEKTLKDIYVVKLDPKMVDIGIMQINLYYHGAKFDSISQLFEPDYNINYAASFLSSKLKECDNDMMCAVGRYHSKSKSKQQIYLKAFKRAYSKEAGH